MIPPSTRKGLLFWILPLLIALAGFGISRLNVAEIQERRLLDARFKIRGPRSISETPFQIVTVDDQTFASLLCKWPFGGSKFARMIRNLNRAGARLIVFDVEFTEPNVRYPAEDTLFADAVEEAGNVILAGKIAFTFSDQFEEPYASPVPPIPVLEKTGAPWGFVNEITDADDFTRRYLLYLPLGERLKPSLGIEVIRALRNGPDSVQIRLDDGIAQFGDLRIPLFDPQSFLINYYGPAGTFPAISFSSVLDDSTFDLADNFDSDYMEQFLSASEVDSGAVASNPFRGKVILVGVSAEELHDNKNTPFYDFQKTPRKMPGVEVHAHALQTILDRSFISRSSSYLVLICSILLAYLIFALVGARKPQLGILFSVVVVIVLLAVAIVLFGVWNFWLDLVAPFAAIALAYLCASLYNFIIERREKARIREMFAHYVPDQVVNELLRHPELLKLGGEKRRLTILFADIEKFTTVSEKIAAEDLVILLNEFMTAMTDVILAEGGIIDKYEGDLIMAEFGAPLSFTDHAPRACRAALKMQQKLMIMRQEWGKAGKPPLCARIGINTGDVIVGNMGSRYLFDYTVLGDAVNLCARLENANKMYRTSILISQSTRDELPDHFVTRVLGDLRVRGRDEAVRIFELVGADPAHLDPTRIELISKFNMGWSHFKARKWDEAASCFKEASALDPDDYPSRIYVKFSRRFHRSPPPADWDGAFTFDEP